MNTCKNEVDDRYKEKLTVPLVCEDDGDWLGLVCHRGDCFHCSMTPLIGFLGLTRPLQNVPEGHHNFRLISLFTGKQNLVLALAVAGLPLVGLDAALDATCEWD